MSTVNRRRRRGPTLGAARWPLVLVYVSPVDAGFEDARGFGHRADDVRSCRLTFVK